MEKGCVGSVAVHLRLDPMEKDLCTVQISVEGNGVYERECLFCGKEFANSTRKFCSRDCYIRSRFWKQEDTAEAVKLLLDGKGA